MSTWSYVTITFKEPVLSQGCPENETRVLHINLGELGFNSHGVALVDRFDLPLVSHPSALADWSREITEAEYIDLVGPADIGARLAKHQGLRWMMDWRSEPGHENHYGQIEAMFELISEFRRGNQPLRYQLTVSDMG